MHTVLLKYMGLLACLHTNNVHVHVLAPFLGVYNVHVHVCTEYLVPRTSTPSSFFLEGVVRGLGTRLG